jgi:hypothetical protein
MKFESKHRWSGAVLFECELPQEVAERSNGRQLGYALKEAIKADANLADANLAGADLADADLADAYLADAYLAGAYLAGANLADANLADAKNMPGVTPHTDPPEPYERATKPEQYAKRAERYRQRHPDVPVIPDLDRQILQMIESGKGQLDMSQWHACETTHCRAGWAITFAGDAGKRLETQFGPAVAGRMIYLASTGRSPHFYATNERARDDIRACAAR